MKWIILVVCFLLFVGNSIYRRASRIVVGYDIVQDDEDQDYYFCKFKFNGYEQDGYFIFEGGKLPEVPVLKIIGYDCTSQMIQLELMND